MQKKETIWKVTVHEAKKRTSFTTTDEDWVAHYVDTLPHDVKMQDGVAENVVIERTVVTSETVWMSPLQFLVYRADVVAERMNCALLGPEHKQ